MDHQTEAVEEVEETTLRGGRSRTASFSSPPTNKQRTATPGESELQRLIEQAEYETQDPYRGLFRKTQSLEAAASVSTPWDTCRWGSFPPEPLRQLDELKDPQLLVRHAVSCSCPSLHSWCAKSLSQNTKAASTSNAAAKKRRKNSKATEPDTDDSTPRAYFVVPGRPDDEFYCCPCDFNPFCLGTLGGVVNEVLQERCQSLDARLQESLGENTNTSLPKLDSEEPSVATRVDQKDVTAIDIVTSEPKPKKGMDIDQTFAFLDGDTIKSTDATTTSGQSSRLSFLDPLQPSTIAQDNPANEDMHSLLTPSEFFTSPSIRFTDINFSAETIEAHTKLRQPVEVEIPVIRAHIYHALKIQHSASEREDGLTTDKYLQILQEWHKHLLYGNLKGELQVSVGNIALALPAGIQNLGATCYLNTQLQCLAQNPTFLNGIFSWRKVEPTHNMNSVMTTLQLLLAQMLIGGEGRLTTLAFSNALGLEHFEQQDPNEFARLLFDRMEESFQQCDNNGDLATLLQSIFQGETTYETVCKRCKSKSKRNEGFMDVNLPIVKRPPGTKLGTIVEYFTGSGKDKNVDTDVQFCLDQYTHPETLDGENQYFCDHCNSKQDAERTMSFSKLPPVLNVQLSRYVFDRVKLMKKKVSEKVLLPFTLDVKQCDGKPKRYLLCAVMRHHGSSAYSGHYTAEAMDWLSGAWYEFNDESVKLLPCGPSCSFLPEREIPKNTMGSQDAYNMYYVHDEYLSSTAAATICRRASLWQGYSGVLDEVSKERQLSYDNLTRRCEEDRQISDRMQRRKLALRKIIFQDASTLVSAQDLPQQRSGGYQDFGCWMDMSFLKGYLRCQPEISVEGQLKLNGPIINIPELLCTHGRLSPSGAIEGKVLPTELYESLLSLIEGERSFLGNTFESADLDENNLQVEGQRITPDKNLVCTDCGLAYQLEISQKLSIVKAAKDLYDYVENSNNNDPRILYFDAGSEPMSEEEKYAFAVSRTSVTKFRQNFSAFLKVVANLEGHNMSGLASLDLSRLHDPHLGSSKPGSTIEDFVNGTITCPHGNCDVMNNRSKVRYLSSREWNLVQQLFPLATPFRIERTLRDGNRIEGKEKHTCPICRSERNKFEEFRDAVVEWGKATKADDILKDVLDGRRTLSHERLLLNFINADNGGRIVHKRDIETWQRAVKAMSSPSKLKGENLAELVDFVATSAFPSCHSVVLQFEREATERLAASIRSFICCKHQKVIQGSVFEKAASNDEGRQETLSDFVTILSQEEYNAYATSLSELFSLVHSYQSGEPEAHTIPDLADCISLISANHPRVGSPAHGEEMLRLSLDGAEKEFTLRPGLCGDEDCMNEFAPYLSTSNIGTLSAENVSWESGIQSVAAGTNVCREIGTVAAEAILIESDLEDTLPDSMVLRVYESRLFASDDDIVDSLRLVSESSNSAPVQTELRRSSRKRKAVYPCGVLIGEDSLKVSLEHNLAAVRLQLYESCNIPLSDCLAAVVSSDKDEKPQVHHIPASAYESPMSFPDWIDIICTSGPGFDPKKHLVLVRRDDIGEEDIDMELLISCSNMDQSHGKSNKKEDTKEKKSTNSERGFRGTLLQSSSVQNATANPDPKPIAVEALAVSDEEDETNRIINVSKEDTREKKSTNSERGFRGTLLQSSSVQNANANPDPKPIAVETLAVSDDEFETNRINNVCQLIPSSFPSEDKESNAIALPKKSEDWGTVDIDDTESNCAMTGTPSSQPSVAEVTQRNTAPSGSVHESKKAKLFEMMTETLGNVSDSNKLSACIDKVCWDFWHENDPNELVAQVLDRYWA